MPVCTSRLTGLLLTALQPGIVIVCSGCRGKHNVAHLIYILLCLWGHSALIEALVSRYHYLVILVQSFLGKRSQGGVTTEGVPST